MDALVEDSRPRGFWLSPINVNPASGRALSMQEDPKAGHAMDQPGGSLLWP